MLILERSILVKLFARKRPPKGLLLLELWTHNGLIYLRYASTGLLHMNIVNETCSWRNNYVIQDCIASEIDFMKLSKGRRPTRNLQVSGILKAYRQFGENWKCNELSFGVGILVSNSEVRFEVNGDLVTADWFTSVLRSSAMNISSMNETYTLEMAIKQATQATTALPLS